MKKFCSYSLTLLTAALLTACSEDYDNGTAGKGTPLTLTAGTDVATRAASNIQSTVFDAGETLNAYITAKKTGDADIVIGAPAVCTTKAAEGGNNPLTAMPQPYFPFEGGYTLDVYALYPAKVTSGVTSFAVSEDQKADGEYKASDLMWAGDHSGNKALTGFDQATTTTIDLPFRHKMAKLIVKVTPAEGNGGNGVGTVSSIRLKNVYRNIGFSPLKGQLGDAATLTNIGDIELGDTGLGSDVDGDNVGDGNACLFPPQTVQGDFLEVVTDGGGTAKFAIVGQKRFDEGEEYTVTISLSAGNMGKTAAIADWPNDGDKEHHLEVKALGAGSLQVAEIADIDPDNAATQYTEKGTTKYKPQSLTVTCNGVTLTEGTDYTAVYYNNAAAGQYGVVVVTGIGNYADAGTGAQTFLIKSGQLIYTPEPEAAGTLVYNGSAQSLLGNEPSARKRSSDAEVVPIKYCATETGYYSTTKPTATNAGKYYFWYKVDDKDGYSGIPPRRCGPIVIQKADLDLDNVTITRPMAITGLKYNEKLQQLVTPASCSVNGNSVAVTYCLGTDATTPPTTGYTAEVPMRSDAGTYYVWWQVGGDNYNGTEPQCIPVTIEKGPGRINFSPTSLKFDVTDRKNKKKIVHINRAGTGAVTASCDNPNINVEISADYSTMTVTRLTENVDQTDIEITVTVAESVNCYTKSEVFKVTLNKCQIHLDEVKSTDQKYLGYIVSSTGYIYPNNDDGLAMLQTDGGQPAGMISYLGNTDYSDNGFVLALHDVGNGEKIMLGLNETRASAYEPKISKLDGSKYAWKLGNLPEYQHAITTIFLKTVGERWDGIDDLHWTSEHTGSGAISGDFHWLFKKDQFTYQQFIGSLDHYLYKVRPIFAF